MIFISVFITLVTICQKLWPETGNLGRVKFVKVNDRVYPAKWISLLKSLLSRKKAVNWITNYKI